MCRFYKPIENYSTSKIDKSVVISVIAARCVIEELYYVNCSFENNTKSFFFSVN